MIPLLETPRLILREWRASDIEPFAALNRDPIVMLFFPHVLDQDQTLAYVEKTKNHFREHGIGKWAVELKETSEFIGSVGLDTVDFDAPFNKAPEIGWRLASHHWGKGYATEAAAAAVTFMFEAEGCPEIVSFTAVQNKPSRRVMEKIGMTYDAGGDFDHPKLPVGHPLRRHVLYRIRNTSA